MSVISRFFSMSRNERLGTLVIVIVVALAISVLFVSRHKSVTEPLSASQQAELEQYRAQMSELAAAKQVADTAKTKKSSKSKRSKEAGHSRTVKPSKAKTAGGASSQGGNYNDKMEQF